MTKAQLLRSASVIPRCSDCQPTVLYRHLCSLSIPKPTPHPEVPHLNKRHPFKTAISRTLQVTINNCSTNIASKLQTENTTMWIPKETPLPERSATQMQTLLMITAIWGQDVKYKFMSRKINQRLKRPKCRTTDQDATVCFLNQWNIKTKDKPMPTSKSFPISWNSDTTAGFILRECFEYFA